MKKLKFIRDVAVKAIHREAGSIHEIEDRDADLLIAEGSAILAPAPIETATAKPAKETAARR
jgi:hypothetical protein